ncbi:Nitrogen assimilation transcription factor nit-4 [Meristemomyces frigidus]|nr:Nitrogen assimilation transcription factor nit-4 [Meristemomyces frigidus]
MDPSTAGRTGQSDAKRLFGIEAEGSIDPSARAHAQAASKHGRRGSRRKNNSAEAEADDAAKRRCTSKPRQYSMYSLQVYGTECIYDPNSDHRRKGVYKNDIDNLKTRNTTLQTLIQAILNYPEEDVPDLVREIRTCESLDAVAEKIVAKEHGLDAYDDEDEIAPHESSGAQAPTFETQLYGKLGDLRLDDGSVRYIGGTSNLIHLTQEDSNEGVDEYSQQEDPITSWTEVTDDPELVVHLLNMYFTWHYTYFTTLSKTLFYRDFLLGQPPETTRRKTYYCSPLLVNAILALGCHFTSHSGARDNPEDSATAGDHFFREAKRLIMENDEHEKPRLATVQALALMSVREAGCGREAKGWVYSGMSFRMACDMGLNLDSGRLTSNKGVNGDEAEEDVRRITFWGCFLFDKCWSNYLGRLPQLPTSIITVPKVEVFLDEDAAQWAPYTDSGFTQAHAQPARTRTVALQITKLCEISNDLMKHFYNPTDMERTKGKAAELKKLSDIHTRLESWRRDLPKELEPKEGGLSSVLVMHMFFQLLFIHLFRPFLKYTQATSPLPHTVSPRKLCTQAATMISKLMRLYKRSHGLRQICNIAVYIVHSACTIHLLNCPEKAARRDIVHGVKHLEEIAESWLCARRTLSILSALASKWNVDLPDEAAAVLARTDAKFGSYNGEISSPSGPARRSSQPVVAPPQYAPPAAWQRSGSIPNASNYFKSTAAGVGATTGAPMVRNNSGNYALPPQDANGLLAQQYPSAVPTPASAQGSHRSKDSTGTKSATSPSDIFGGVDQLLRDSQDWVYRDQAQFATGFENWNDLDLDPSTWTSPVAGDGVVNGGMNGAMNGGAVGGSVTNGMSVPNVSAAYTNGNGLSASNGFPMANQLGFGSIILENEDDWYR